MKPSFVQPEPEYSGLGYFGAWLEKVPIPRVSKAPNFPMKKLLDQNV